MTHDDPERLEEAALDLVAETEANPDDEDAIEGCAAILLARLMQWCTARGIAFEDLSKHATDIVWLDANEKGDES